MCLNMALKPLHSGYPGGAVRRIRSQWLIRQLWSHVCLFVFTGGSVVELVPLTEDLTAPPTVEAYLPPAKPEENTPGKTQDQPRTMS